MDISKFVHHETTNKNTPKQKLQNKPTQTI